ncbi:MAG: ATP-binding protein [Epulopiscium sp.]|nr:ATP-binding protein [Candidatus Epulonipiscium sp.]
MTYEYIFDKNKCWYTSACGKYETPECNAGCIRYMEMDYLMQNSGIPRNRQYAVLLTPSKKDVQAFITLKEIKDDILNFVKNGESIYIYSDNFGNGKTTWAIKLLQKYFDDIWVGNGFRCRGIFIHVPTFLTKIKEGISRKDEDFETLKSRLMTVDLVIWDDIAATKLGDFDHANLLTYIDQRKLNQLSNIYTGNLHQDELRDALGNRLASRVWNDSTSIRFIGADRRGIK